MSNNRRSRDGLAVYQETITRAYSQSKPIPHVVAHHWTPHTNKWRIYRDDFTDARITSIMKTIWKRTKASPFFKRLNVPESVIMEVDDFIGTVHAWKKPGGNKDYTKSPGYIRWAKKKSTSTLICAIIHMVPFDIKIPWNMHFAEDRVLRDAVAMANGFGPCRSYPEKFEEGQDEVTVHKHAQPEKDTQNIAESDAEGIAEPDTQRIAVPNHVHTPLVDTNTRPSMQDDYEMTMVDLTGQTECHEQAVEKQGEPLAKAPDTTSRLDVSTDFNKRRSQFNQQIRSLLLPDYAPVDPDTKMPLVEPELCDPNMMVDYLRAEMEVQIAAAVHEVKREHYEQRVRTAAAIELLMEERDKTLESVVSALKREATKAKKEIFELQNVVSNANKTISDLRAVVSERTAAVPDAQTRTIQQKESATQTPPQVTDLTSEEMHAILYGVLADRPEALKGPMVLL